MKTVRIIAALAFLLPSTILLVSEAEAQLCGGSFAKVTISDSEGRNIPDAFIELIAEVPDEEFRRAQEEESALKVSLPEGTIKVSTENAEKIIERKISMSRTKDFCGNPLKQRAGLTIVKSLNEGSSAKGFGFCTIENNFQAYLLRISAPGYVTDYYVGPFLGRCRRTYGLVLARDTSSVSHRKDPL